VVPVSSLQHGLVALVLASIELQRSIGSLAAGSRAARSRKDDR
jgi:hypothetical protein